MSKIRFETTDERQMLALECIADQLERLNKNIEKVLGERAVKVNILGSVGVASTDY